MSSKGNPSQTAAKGGSALDEIPEHVRKRHDAALDRRSRRYDDFKNFSEQSETLFEKIAEADDDLRYLHALYTFYVSPGGPMGGSRPRAVEVFFGKRAYDSESSATAHRFLIESGARLSYERTDSGAVLCLLAPATSENTKRTEKMFLLEVIKNPSHLLIERTLKRHLAYLTSCMAVTSLDGDPTISQRLRYAWLWSVKSFVKEQKLKKARYSREARRIGRWVATIALSGCALFFIQRIWPESDAVQARAQADATARANVAALRDSTAAIQDSTAALHDFLASNAAAAEHLQQMVDRLGELSAATADAPASEEVQTDATTATPSAGERLHQPR